MENDMMVSNAGKGRDRETEAVTTKYERSSQPLSFIYIVMQVQARAGSCPPAQAPASHFQLPTSSS